MQTDIRSSIAVADPAWTSVCSLDQLEPLFSEAALVGGVQLALVLLPDGSLYAVSNQDPVTGSFVMSRGIIGSRGDRTTLASPLHKQVYDLETGQCYTAAEHSLPTYPVRVDNGMVQVQMTSATGRAPVGAAAEFVAA